MYNKLISENVIITIFFKSRFSHHFDVTILVITRKIRLSLEAPSKTPSNTCKIIGNTWWSRASG